MSFKDPQIAVGPALSARACQAVFPLIRRLQYSSPDVHFATKPIAGPDQIIGDLLRKAKDGPEQNGK